jgi:hypothetical protein
MFTALMMVNVGLIGFIGSNFGSIAMEDFGHMAGVASSYQSFAKTLLGGGRSARLIGQQYDGIDAAAGLCVPDFGASWASTVVTLGRAGQPVHAAGNGAEVALSDIGKRKGPSRHCRDGPFPLWINHVVS